MNPSLKEMLEQEEARKEEEFYKQWRQDVYNLTAYMLRRGRRTPKKKSVLQKLRHGLRSILSRLGNL